MAGNEQRLWLVVLLDSLAHLHEPDRSTWIKSRDFQNISRWSGVSPQVRRRHHERERGRRSRQHHRRRSQRPDESGGQRDPRAEGRHRRSGHTRQCGRRHGQLLRVGAEYPAVPVGDRSNQQRAGKGDAEGVRLGEGRRTREKNRPPDRRLRPRASPRGSGLAITEVHRREDRSVSAGEENRQTEPQIT